MTYQKMKPQERRACAEMAARAFADYEYFSVDVPNGKKRAHCLKHMLNTSFTAYKDSAVFLTARKNKKLAAVAQSVPCAPLPPRQGSI